MTCVLGGAIQYCFLTMGMLIFPKGYGFADMDTSGCATLAECFVAHLDYGFRSAPVWHDPYLSWTMFAFDYLYNLIVILILAAIISGIIIDTFADMRATTNDIKDDQENNCFMCCLNRSALERKMVKFEHHIYQEHYMWSYARFLMYLTDQEESELNGPESYVKMQVQQQNYQFYPIERALSLETEDAEGYSERQLKVKDLEELREQVKSCSTEMESIIQVERELKGDLKDSRELVHQLGDKLGKLGTEVGNRLQAMQADQHRQNSAAKK